MCAGIYSIRLWITLLVHSLAVTTRQVYSGCAPVSIGIQQHQNNPKKIINYYKTITFQFQLKYLMF